MTLKTIQHLLWHDRELREGISRADADHVARVTGCEIGLDGQDADSACRVRIRCASEDLADGVARLLACFALDRRARERLSLNRESEIQMHVDEVIGQALGRIE